MTYKYCQDQLSTVIQTVSGFTGDNVKLGDYRVLAHGYEKSVVLRPGSFSRKRASFAGGIQPDWNIIIELFIKYRDDAQVTNDIRDERQGIIDKVDQYPFLNTAGTGTIFHAMITGGAEPVPVFGEDNSGPHFMMQEMTCAVTEQITITEAE